MQFARTIREALAAMTLILALIVIGFCPGFMMSAMATPMHVPTSMMVTMPGCGHSSSATDTPTQQPHEKTCCLEEHHLAAAVQPIHTLHIHFQAVAGISPVFTSAHLYSSTHTSADIDASPPRLLSASVTPLRI